MATHASHAIELPVRGARYTLEIAYLDADGDPTDPTTPDTEIAKDGGGYSDCLEEVTTLSGSNGTGLITLSGEEMDCGLAVVCAKVASGPKNTLGSVRTRNLPVFATGTVASAADTTHVTLPSTFPSYDISGTWFKTTGGTGGGGTGGRNNQARKIMSFNVSTKEIVLDRALETAVDNTTTFALLDPTPDAKFMKPSNMPLFEGPVVIAANNTLTLPTNHNISTQAQLLARLVGGTNAIGKSRFMAWSGSGGVFTVDKLWDADSETTPTGTLIAVVETVPAQPASAANMLKVDVRALLGTLFTESGFGRIVAGIKKMFDVVTPVSTMESLTAVVTVTNLTNAPSNGDFTGTMKASITTAVPTAAAIATAVWGVLTSTLTTANTIGKWIVDKLDVVLSTRAVAGDAMTLTSGERQTLANKVESEIIDETDSEKVLTAITDKIASVNPSLGGLTVAAIATAVRDKVYAGSAAGSLGEALASMVARLPGSGTLSTLDATGVRGAIGLAASNLDTQITALAALVASSAIGDATWDEPIEPKAGGGNYTAREIMRGLFAAELAKATGFDTNNPRFRDGADTKDRINATTSVAGRDAVTLDLT